MSGRVLITGASGFVGRRLVQRFAADGRAVTTVSRLPADASSAGLRSIRVADISASTDWTDALRDVELVVHCAAHIPMPREPRDRSDRMCHRVNHEGTRALAEQALRLGVRRFVFLSSIKVNGESTPVDRPFDAESVPAPEDAYGRSKRDAELALAALRRDSTGMETVVFRPPLVYGPHAKGNMASLMRWLRRGVPLPLGGVTDNRRSLVGIDNLVDAIARAAVHPAAANRTFLISDGEDVSTAELLRRLGRAVGRPAHLLPVPPALLSAGARVLGGGSVAQRLLSSLRVDASALRAALDWHPPVPLDEGLKRMAFPS